MRNIKKNAGLAIPTFVYIGVFFLNNFCIRNFFSCYNTDIVSWSKFKFTHNLFLMKF